MALVGKHVEDLDACSVHNQLLFEPSRRAVFDRTNSTNNWTLGLADAKHGQAACACSYNIGGEGGST